ncbi:hypothetical protein ACFC4G_41770 [Streptomyces sp. NPDC056002]|uniref:hypothetical protein n=1 Tax=Streptomyces sp. NPDC056002 TaxID=3345675 RepID=UPI0035E0F807
MARGEYISALGEDGKTVDISFGHALVVPDVTVVRAAAATGDRLCADAGDVVLVVEVTTPDTAVTDHRDRRGRRERAERVGRAGPGSRTCGTP